MHLLTSWLAGLAVGLPGGPSPAPSRPPAPLQDAAASADVVLLRAERVVVRPGRVLEDAAVLVRDGRIEAVGTDVEAPDDAVVIEGAVVCAGFIDPWSTLGVTRDALNDRRADAATRSLDAFDPFASAPARAEALRAGVVAVRLQASDDSEVGGVGSVVSTGPSPDLEQLVLLADASVSGTIGITEGNRTVEVLDRIGQVDKLVGEIEDGRDYDLDWAEYRHELAVWVKAIAEKEAELEKDFKKAKKDREKEIAEAEEKDKEFKEKRYKEDRKPRTPKYDAEKAVMARVANGELPLVVQAHRAAELRELLAGTRQFERLRLVVSGGTEALTVAEELAERKIPVIVWPAPLGERRADELEAHDLGLAGRLAAEGVSVLIGSRGGAARDLPLLAALAVGHGLDREEAFAALTERAARTFDVADQLGTVQRGRRADLLVLDGDPLAPATRVLQVLLGGRVVDTNGNQ